MTAIAALIALWLSLLAGPPPRDMTAVYPGPVAHIDGFNYVTGQPSALTFTRLSPSAWKQSNSADGCNWDGFEWGSTLHYFSTHHDCEGVEHDTLYNPPVDLMPAQWDGGRWTSAGQSTVSTYVDGVPTCRGLMSWRAYVDGVEQITPTEKAVHVSTRQTTTWTHGPCAPWTTDWQEDYYFTDHLRRSVGGNLEVDAGRWDVWFD